MERREVKKMTYSRHNHMSECLDLMYGAEATRVQREIIDAVRGAIPTHAELSIPVIQQALKSLRLHNLQNHAVQIYWRLQGVEPQALEPQVKRQLLRMFTRCERAWEKVQPPFRKNFLPYPFLASKLLQLQGLEVLPPEPTKSQYTERARERLWKNVCQEAGWRFIPQPKARL
jgi:hypothetical protein